MRRIGRERYGPCAVMLAVSLLAGAVPGLASPLGDEASPQAGACGESWQFLWPHSCSPTCNQLRGVAWTGSEFVVVGPVGMIMTSPDARAWAWRAGGGPPEPCFFPPCWEVWPPDLAGVTSAGGTIVAVGSAGTILTSPDGIAWTQRPRRSAFDLTAVAWTGTQVVAVGGGGTILTSPDAVTWTPRVSPTTEPLFGVAWAGTQLAAVGKSGAILTSPDGVVWTLQSSATQADLAGVGWTGTQLVAVGANGTILTSADGIAWSPQSSGTSERLSAVAWTGTRLVTVGLLGTIASSEDGIAWSVLSSPTSERLNGVAWDGTRLLAVGDHGTIVTAPCAAACVPPSITSQPASAIVAPGRGAMLSVSAAGASPLSFQWYQGPAGNTSMPVGTNSATFTTPAPLSATSYWVRVSNACGQADSAVATVTLEAAPRLHLPRRE